MNLDDLLMGLRNQRIQRRVPIQNQPANRRQAASQPSRVPAKPGQAAIDFGRSFTGGQGVGAEAVDRLSRQVFSNLSGKGLYKDASGSWQIRGLERPDVTRQIRDSAISAMGGPDWSRLVQQSEQNIVGGLKTPGAGLPSSSRVPGSGEPIPSTGTGGVPGTKVTPTGATQSGVGGLPPRGPYDPNQPAIMKAALPSAQPGTGSVPSTPSRTTDLSGLGASISGKVTSSIAGTQENTPTSGSIQQVVEQSLRSRGLTPPTGGPLTPPSRSGPQVGQIPTATRTGTATSGPVQGTRPGQAPAQPMPSGSTGVTQYPNPAARNGTSSTTAQPGGQQTPVAINGQPTAQAPAYTSSTENITAPGAGTSGMGVGAPQGTIPLDLNLAYGRGDSWDQVNQYDDLFVQYGNQYGVDPAVLKAIAVVETGGRMIPNGNGNEWTGLMQIDGVVWGTTAAQMGFDLNTEAGQIGFAAAMLGGAVPGVSGSNWQERFVNNYYPTGCMDCTGADGGTPRQYLEDIDRLTSIIYGSPQGGGMAPSPGQAPSPTGNVPISQAQLNAIGAGTGGVQPVSSGGNYPDVYSSGAGLPNGYNPGAGPAVQLDPATGKMVPVPGQSSVPPSQSVINPSTGGPAPIASTPPQYVDMVNQSATKYGVPANILSALLQVESGWDPNAYNKSSGASGLGQCIGSTCQGLGVTDPFDPAQAIDGAAKYLAQNYAIFGDWNLAVAAYQAGPGNVQAAGNQIPNTTDGITATPDYVKNIMGLAGPITGPNATTAPVDPVTGTEITSAGGGAPPTSRQPKVTGTISPMATPTQEMTGISQGSAVPQGDGLGIYAGPNADESWVSVLSPNGGINGDYKEYVCSDRYGEYGCCNGGECSYTSTAKYLDPRSANQTVHPGYDIALADGTPFYAPIGGVVLGTDTNSGGQGCIAPDQTINECSWAYDNGMVIGGITDSEGGEIYINFDHTSPDESLVGQAIQPGQPLGVGLDKGHVHVESHGYCSDSGTMVVLDPSLVMGGYYNTHSVCEGVTRPVTGDASGSSGYMNPNSQLGQQYAAYQASNQSVNMPPQGQGVGSTTSPMAGTRGVSLPPGMSQGTPSYEPEPSPQALPPGQSQGSPSYEPAPSPQALPPGMSQGTPSYESTLTYSPPPNIVTDEYGRQYSIDPNTGYATLIYDPMATGGPR